MMNRSSYQNLIRQSGGFPYTRRETASSVMQHSSKSLRWILPAALMLILVPWGSGRSAPAQPPTNEVETPDNAPVPAPIIVRPQPNPPASPSPSSTPAKRGTPRSSTPSQPRSPRIGFDPSAVGGKSEAAAGKSGGSSTNRSTSRSARPNIGSPAANDHVEREPARHSLRQPSESASRGESGLPPVAPRVGSRRQPTTAELLKTPVKVDLFPERTDQEAAAQEGAEGWVTDSRGRPVVSTSALPSHHKTRFFGVEAPGQVFVFIIDQSGSMEAGDRMSRAKRELRSTIRALEFPQRFQVIAFNDVTRVCQSLPATATEREKEKFERWLGTIVPEGGTEPRRALAEALAIRPDAVFLLTDGELPPGTAQETAQLNARAAQANGGDLVPIHCIDLSGGLPSRELARIARESGGILVAPRR